MFSSSQQVPVISLAASYPLRMLLLASSDYHQLCLSPHSIALSIDHSNSYLYFSQFASHLFQDLGVICFTKCYLAGHKDLFLSCHLQAALCEQVFLEGL